MANEVVSQGTNEVEIEYKTPLSQREANKKWVEKNREHFNELCRVNNIKYHKTSDKFKESNKLRSRVYYEENKEKISQRQKEYYQKKKAIKQETLLMNESQTI